MEAGIVDPGTPADVDITREARRPVDDSTLGIPVAPRPARGTPRHRLVAIGDSLTQGFKNFAIRDTRLSYPAMIARELGWERDFRVPLYDGPGGLPLDLEWLLRALESEFGAELERGEAVNTVLAARRLLEAHEDFWERGPAARPARGPEINHNLAIFGWDCATRFPATPTTAATSLSMRARNRGRRRRKTAPRSPPCAFSTARATPAAGR